MPLTVLAQVTEVEAAVLTAPCSAAKAASCADVVAMGIRAKLFER